MASSLNANRKAKDQRHFDEATRWLKKHRRKTIRAAFNPFRWTVRPKSGFLGASQVRGGSEKPLTPAQIQELRRHKEPGPERLNRKERRRLERQNRRRRP